MLINLEEDMIESKKLKAIRIAYKSGNYQESYTYASEFILETSNPDELAQTWMFKSISTARLTTAERPRLAEACLYLQEAQGYSYDKDPILVLGGDELADLVLWQARQLHDYYTAKNDAEVARQSGHVTYHSNESGSERAGRELGQRLADSYLSIDRRKKASSPLGEHFLKYHNTPIVNALTLAFNITGGSEDVVNNIADTADIIINLIAISPRARRQFDVDIASLKKQIWAIDSERKIYRMNKLENIPCPRCGYEDVAKDRGLISIFIGSGPTKKASYGTSLKCNTCYYRWKHGE